MYNVAVVEDELSAFKVLDGYLARYSADHGEQFQVDHFASAVEFLDKFRPFYDLIFMDIELPGINGMEASHLLREKDPTVTLIFVTNMAQYAIKGYEVDAFDFVVKPLSYYDFSLKLGKALTRMRMSGQQTITVQTEGGLRVVPTSSLLYVEVMRHKLTFHTDEGAFDGYGSLTTVEAKLPAEQFVRCKACYLVNLKRVTKVSENSIMVGTDELSIGRSKKREFMEALTNFLVKEM